MSLADNLGVTYQQVQKYESGRNRMSSDKIVRAADFLKVPRDALLPADGNSAVGFAEAQRPYDSDPRSLDADRVRNAYARISDPEQRRIVRELIAVLLAAKPARRA